MLNAPISKKRTRKKKVDPNQIDFLAFLDGEADLISVPEEPAQEQGALSFELKIRTVLSNAIKQSGLNREQIAEMLSAHVNRPITKSMLDSFTGAGRPNRLPADLLPALTAVLGPGILIEIAGVSGCRLVERHDAQLARLGQLYLVDVLLRKEQEATLAQMPLFRQRSIS